MADGTDASVTDSDPWTKIGVMVPSSNTSVEIDFRRAALPGVSIHSARMWLTGSDADGLDRMNEDIETAARHLGSADVKLLVYACTGGSLLKGIGYDRKLAAEISEKAGGIPTITTSTAALEALETLGLKRLSLLTPYPATMTRIVKEFLVANGYEVLSVAGRGHGSNLEIGADPIEAIAEFALSNDAAETDGFFCSCTNWRSMAAAEAIERETGKPVVTSNQSTIWAAYRALGLDAKIEGYGRLLRGG
jgi:maleate isomerase